MSPSFVELFYLVATALFVFSLHWMNDPKTARRGVIAGRQQWRLVWPQHGSSPLSKIMVGWCLRYLQALRLVGHCLEFRSPRPRSVPHYRTPSAV